MSAIVPTQRRSLLMSVLATALTVRAGLCQPDGAASQPAAPIRVALRARGGGADRLTPLRYIGGFETKTLVYETLVRRAADGRLEPGLASSWRISADGRTFHFALRPGARFHDGTPVTAEAVRTHFRRWVGLPEHDWLLCNRHITDVRAESERIVTVTLDEPYALLADLCAINPCAVVGPGARDWEGEFVRPMGTGPFRFVATVDGGQRWRLQPTQGDGPDLEIAFYPRGRDTAPITALQSGTIDAFVGGWDEDLPAEALDRLAQDERFRVVTSAGSSVVYLSFRQDGPTAATAVRQRIAAAIDRAELVRVVEGGRADPCTSWAAPALAAWPRPRTVPAAPDAAAGAAAVPRLRIAANRREGRAGRVAEAVAAQLRRAGLDVELVAPEPASRPTPGLGDSGETTARPATAVGTVQPTGPDSGEVRAAQNRAQRLAAEQADLRVEITHGAPYDPHQSLVARFGPQRPGERPRTGVDARLYELVTLASMTPDEEQCRPIYTQIQELMDREALIVPLYSPWRIALHAATVDGIRLTPDAYAVDLTGLRRVAR